MDFQNDKAEHFDPKAIVVKQEILKIKDEKMSEDVTDVFKKETVKIKEEAMSEDDIDKGVFLKPLVHVVSKSQTSLYVGHIPPSKFSKIHTNVEENAGENSEGHAQFEKLLSDPVMLLENCGPQLEGSSCYCKDCEILFPTIERLHAHNKSEHSFLVPANTNIIKPSKGTKNILYQCKTCDILYDNYDQAVEHSQNHFNNMANDIATIHCFICNMKFDIPCFNKHKELHAENKEINKDSFKIVTFDYTAMFTSKWMDMFRAAKVTEKQISALMDRSIYFQNRDVKFKVVKDGPDNAVLFRCAKCGRHINSVALKDHMITCDVESVYICPINNCWLQFCGSEAPWHVYQHKWTDTFKIVVFNKETDKEFNEALKLHSTKNKITNTSTELSANNSTVFTHCTEMKTRNKKKYNFYQCKKCKCCTDVETDLNTHRCWFSLNKTRCDKCDLFFSWNYSRHKKLHEYVNIDKDMIRVNAFKPKAEPKPKPAEDETVKLYKCDCGLHFTSIKAIETHFKSCTESQSPSEECGICKRVFNPPELAIHLRKHQSQRVTFEVIPRLNIKKRKINNIIKNKIKDSAEMTNHARTCGTNGRESNNNIYHCMICSLNFMKFEDLESHAMSGIECGNHVPKFKCSVCGLLFTKATLKTHNEMHHNQMKLTLKNLNVIKTKFDIFNTAKDKVVDSRVLMKGILGDFLGQSQNAETEKADKNSVENTQKTETKPADTAIESTLNDDFFSNTLYKCDSCSTHFLTADILDWHTRNLKHDVAKSTCTFCGYAFTVNDLPTHVFIHHDQMGSTRNNFEIISNNGKIADDSANGSNNVKCEIMT